jgi:hypothetical protein
LNTITQSRDRLVRAWELIRRENFLWALGFAAALSGDLLTNDRIGPRLDLGGLLRSDVFDVPGWARGLRLLGGSLVAAALLTLGAGIAMLIVVLLARGGLIAAARALERGESVGLELATGRARTVIGRLVLITVVLYVPYLLASQLAGMAFRLGPGLFRLPVYLILLALLVVSAGLALLHPLAACAVMLDGLKVRSSIGRAWRLARANLREAAVVAAVLLASWVVLSAVARLVLSPVSDVSLLALLLGGLRNGGLSFGGTLGFLMLHAIATAIMAPVYTVGLVTLALMYEDWEAIPEKPAGDGDKPLSWRQAGARR